MEEEVHWKNIRTYCDFDHPPDYYDNDILVTSKAPFSHSKREGPPDDDFEWLREMLDDCHRQILQDSIDGACVSSRMFRAMRPNALYIHYGLATPDKLMGIQFVSNNRDHAPLTGIIPVRAIVIQKYEDVYNESLYRMGRRRSHYFRDALTKEELLYIERYYEWKANGGDCLLTSLLKHC